MSTLLTLLLLGVGQAPEAVEDPGPRHSEARGGPAGQVAHGLAREDLGDKESSSDAEVDPSQILYICHCLCWLDSEEIRFHVRASFSIP